MRLFSDTAAKHFCSSSAAAGQPHEDIDVLVRRVNGRRLVEGSPDFEAYRVNLLRECERRYYLALTLYRRAHNMMLAASMFWAHVTLYYASWYAAHSLVGCFGGWVGKVGFVEVTHDAVGTQSLRIAKKNVPGGSHQSFWLMFYAGVRPVKAIVNVEWLPALEPVSSNDTWQIDTRNRINYQLEGASGVQSAYLRSFDPARFPGSLSGDVATQYEVTRCMIGATAQFLVEMSVATDEFVSRATSLRDEVWEAPATDTVVNTDAQFLI
jgi:hypothetical protein